MGEIVEVNLNLEKLFFYVNTKFLDFIVFDYKNIEDFS